MSNEVFCQDLNEKDAVRPGGPFMIQLLFKEPPIVPTKETMLKIMEKHVGPVELSAMMRQCVVLLLCLTMPNLKMANSIRS